VILDHEAQLAAMMPPAALISSTRMRMPFTVALEKLTIGPDRSCAVPTTISAALTPCCASAGVAPQLQALRWQETSFHFLP
jgi:hypothetical protein